MKYLLEQGAEFTLSALINSMRLNFLNQIPILLEAGADVNARHIKHNYTAIDAAMPMKLLRAIKMLNDAGNQHFPSTFELLFANEPYCYKLCNGCCRQECGRTRYDGVESLSYLINWKWTRDIAEETKNIPIDREKLFRSVLALKMALIL